MSLLRKKGLDLLRAGKTKAGSWDAPYPGTLSTTNRSYYIHNCIWFASTFNRYL